MLPPLGAGGDRGAVHGIAAVAELIARTLGPAGRPAVVRDPADSEIDAPDAETIVACFTPDDPRDRLGAAYVRELVREQHAAVPDGAATAVVLAGAAIEKALKSRKEGAGIDPATGKTVPMRPYVLDILPVVQAAVTNAAALTIRLLTG